MSILPTFIDTQAAAETSVPGTVLPTPREYGVDFQTGQMTGRIVEGIEAIKVWIWNTLHTERYRHAIYSWMYGVEYEQYIGRSMDSEYLQSDCRTETEDALMVSPYLKGIEDFSAAAEDDRLLIRFCAVTTLGRTEVSINV